MPHRKTRTNGTEKGTVIQTGENDQYLVRVHGTGRVTLRNRRFLRRFTLRSSELGDCTPPPGSMQVSSIPKGNGFSQHDSAEEPRPIPQQGTARTVQPTDDHASHPNVMPLSTQPMSGPAPCLNAPHPIAPHSQQPALHPRQSSPCNQLPSRIHSRVCPVLHTQEHLN